MAVESPLVVEEPNYAPLVIASANVAALIFLTQAVASMLLANWLGATTEIDFALGFIPFAAVIAEPATFVTIISWSTFIAVTVTCAAVIRSLMNDKDDPLRLYGWATGIFMALMLLAWQYSRNFIAVTPVNNRVLGVAVFIVLATLLVFVALKPANPLFDDHVAVPARFDDGDQPDLSRPRLPDEYRTPKTQVARTKETAS